MRMIKPKQNVQATYKELKLLELNKLIDLENKKLGYKIHNNLLPIQMSNIIKSDAENKTLKKTHNYDTRNKKVLYLPKIKNNSYQQSFLYCGVKALCSMPMHMLEFTSIEMLVKHHKKELFNNSTK